MSIKTLLYEYDRIREEERLALIKRLAHAAALSPRLEEIRNERHKAALSVGTAIRRGLSPQVAAETAREIIRILDDEEAKLLRSLGLPEDYCRMQYRCERCKDTGYVGESRKTPCACLLKRQAEQERNSAAINARETFETFDLSIFPEEQRHRMQNVRKLCEQYADQFPNGETCNMLLIGAPGLGKSFLLNSIAERVLSRGYAIRKVTAYYLIQDILQGIRTGEDHARPYQNAPLLLIDDLGSEPMMQNITKEYLFSIFNERHTTERHTVVATNLSYEKLQARYGERIFSRLCNRDMGKVLLLEGKDLRLFS